MNRLTTRPKPLSLDAFNDMLLDAPEDERWELIDGRLVRMMVGARLAHAHIVNNLHGALWQQLKRNGSRCHAYSESLRVQVDEANASFLPDIVVNCGPVEPGATAIKSPSVLMEVLSEGTAMLDRGKKWLAYRKIASLRHYALVDCDRSQIEIFDWHDTNWSRRVLEGIDAILALPAVGVEIPFAEIYAGLFA